MDFKCLEAYKTSLGAETGFSFMHLFIAVNGYSFRIDLLRLANQSWKNNQLSVMSSWSIID